MAASTYTVTKLGESRTGQDRVLYYNYNITAAGSDGAPCDASMFGLKRIREVEILGQEVGGYVHQFIPDAQGARYCGDGDIISYESDDAVDPLDANVGDDVGEVRVKIVGY